MLQRLSVDAEHSMFELHKLKQVTVFGSIPFGEVHAMLQIMTMTETNIKVRMGWNNTRSSAIV